MTGIAILVLAAGGSTRMRGRDKLTESVGGEPLLRRQVKAALATGARVIVALPPGADARRAALAGLKAEVLTVEDAAQGMGRSIAAGAKAATGAEALMILPADMARLDTAALASMIEAFRSGPHRIWRGMSAGRPGHPVIFPARLLGDLAGLTGDTGARALLEREAAVSVPLPGDAAVLDLDTPEDWAAFRAAHPDL